MDGQERLVGGPTGGRLKGVMFQGHVAWVHEHGTPDEIAAVFAGGSPELQSLARTILASNWYPFALLIELDRRILAQFGTKHPNLLEELGAYSARKGLETVYRSLVKPSFHAFLQDMAVVHGRYQDYGQVAYAELGPTAAQMTYRGYTVFSPIFCASATGYFKGAIAVHGGRDARALETSCVCRGNAACTYEMHWR